MEARTWSEGARGEAQEDAGANETEQGENVTQEKELGDIWLKTPTGKVIRVATGGSLVRVVARRPRPPRLRFSWEYDVGVSDG
jgi:hypothetical protein